MRPKLLRLGPLPQVWPAVVTLVALAVVLSLQFRSGAFSAEFGRHADEAAHYMNGLLVRDYVAQLAPAGPLEYAREYYLHYPKISIGHWPPLFYVVESTWMLLFTEQRLSLLILLALIAATLGLTLYRLLQPEVGAGAALACLVLFLCLYQVQTSYVQLLIDCYNTLLMVWAALRFARFMESERARDSIIFGLLAAASILSKGGGLALALLPPAAVVLGRRWRLVLRPAFWYSAVMVGVLCAPWYYLTTGLAADGWAHSGTILDYFLEAVPFNALTVVQSTGLLLLPFSVLGLVSLYDGPSDRATRLRWTCLLALALSVFLFHSLVPAGLEKRYLIPAMFVWVMLLGKGSQWLADRLPSRLPGHAHYAAIVAWGALVVFLGTNFLTPPKLHYGYDLIAADLFSDPGLRDQVVFISSEDRSAEGMLISEMAMRDPNRPSRYVLRSTKLMSSSRWSGVGYHSTIGSPAQALELLEEHGVGVLVIGDEPGLQQTHHRILSAMAESRPDRWRLLKRYRPQPRPYLPGIRLYRYIGHARRPFDPAQLPSPFK